MSTLDLPIRAPNPRRLPGWQIPAERVPVGIPGDDKPSMALLPAGELSMVGLFQEQLPGGKVRQWTPLWRSGDAGRTWSKRRATSATTG